MSWRNFKGFAGRVTTTVRTEARGSKPWVNYSANVVQYRPMTADVDRKFLSRGGALFAFFFFSGVVEIEPFGIARLRARPNSRDIRIFFAGYPRTFSRLAITPFHPALVLLLISFDLRLFTSAFISCRPGTLWHQ